MSLQSMIPSLMFMTLFAGAGIAVVMFLSFLRRRSNRVAAEDTLIGSTSRGSVPDGALPELLTIVGVAVVAMGLLTFGYSGSSRAGAPVTELPAGTLSTPAAPDAQMTTPSRPRTTPDANPNVPTSPTSPGPGGG
jgi:hypothetical protein